MAAKLHILIVEDEPSIADTLAYALESDGFVAHRAGTAEAALEAVRRERIALLIVDFGLPDKNGFELLKELRRDSSIPVIMLTARGGEVDRIVGLELGADDYVAKPFSPREVVARVKTVLRRTVSPPEPAQAPGGSRSADFTIDENRYRIAYRGTDLELSRYEFRILSTLIKRPGWVFTREKLMDLCWDAPESSLERTVDAHIKTIRAKLREVTPDHDPIKTHRGIGYSLKEE